MFALPGIGLLIVFIMVRPQEFVPLLQKIPMLYLFALLALVGYAIDVRLRRLQPIASATMPWAIAFVVWVGIATAFTAPDTIVPKLIEMAILLTLYGTIAHGVQRFRTFGFVVGALTASTLFITAVCFDQGLAPRGCIAGEENNGAIEGTPDGRLCETSEQCVGPGVDETLDYRCEHIGWFGTYSVEDRVRYRGDLHDPNEVALVMSSCGLAMLIGFALRRRKAGTYFTTGVACAVVLVTVFMTESRGGLIAAMLVPGVFVIRRYGWRAVIPVALIVIPVLVFGSRSGGDADQSTQERYEAWATGLEMFRHSPLFGVGAGQFVHHHNLTAHNSYVLALAELGLPGLYLFLTMMYLSLKILIVGTRELESVPGTESARGWGMALLAALAGAGFQINTLSFTYHPSLWILFGIVGAWYSAVRHHRPELKISMTARDLVIVAAITLLYAIVVLPIFLRIKGYV